MTIRIFISIKLGEVSDIRLYGSVRALYLSETISINSKEFASERMFANAFNNSVPEGKERTMEIDQGVITERTIKRVKNG